MAYLIGTDEAGYGPNLGPLVITATVWQVAGPATDVDLYRALRAGVRAAASKRPGSHVVIADSKAVYQPQQGLALLERGVLAALTAADCPAASWRELWQVLEVGSMAERDALPWHDGYHTDLPLACEADDVARGAERLSATLAKAEARLVAARSVAVFPAEFNHLAEVWGTKGELLSQLTLGLVGDALALCGPEPTLIVCDKHGGRNRYGRLLQQRFPEWLVQPQCERTDLSTYRWGPDSEAVEIRFRARGESFLPTALASMISKYVREVAMRAFNHFWLQHVPGIRATAGYPGDARRFWDEIREAQLQLGIDDRRLWRNR